MCLGVPGYVAELHGDYATIDINGVSCQASIQLVDNINIGDYVLVHAGYILDKLDYEDAQETLRLIAAMENRANT